MPNFDRYTCDYTHRIEVYASSIEIDVSLWSHTVLYKVHKLLTLFKLYYAGYISTESAVPIAFYL